MATLSLPRRIGRRQLSKQERRNLALGLLFVSPWLIGFLLWTLIPILASFYFSFTRYTVLKAPVFIGFDNYINLLEDEDFHQVVLNTLWWVVFSVPLGLTSAYLLANLLNTKIIFRPFFRALFFFPSIVPAIVTTTVWLFLLNLQWGAFNSVLRALGLQTIPFLSNPDWVKPTIIGIHMWAQGGAMVIFLAALQDVPRELYEAATVDGANEFVILLRIILPLARPALVVVALFTLVASWNDYFGPLIYVNQESQYTLALGINRLRGALTEVGSQQLGFPYLMAVSTIVTIPILFVFAFAQRTFIEGISLTGLKG